MDFFDIMFGKKYGTIPFSKSYFDTLFAAKLAEMQIKTLTGTLPLTFKTSETALRNWTIYGNDYQQEESKTTRLPLSFYTDEDKVRDWTIYGNNNIGKNLCDENSFSILQTDTSAYRLAFSLGKISAGDYTLSYTKKQTSVLYITFRRGATYSSTSADTPYTFSVSSDIDEVIVRTALQTEAPLSDIGISNVMLNAGSVAEPFEPYQIGVGQLTKNVVNLDGVAQVTKGNVTITADATTGYVTVSTRDGEVTNTEAIMQIYLPTGISGDYYLSGSPDGGSESRTFDIYPWDETQSMRPNKWDGTTLARSSIDSTPQEVKFVAGDTYRIGIRIRSGVAADGLVFKPMIRPADTSDTFIPYGYEIPLTVNSTLQTVYIGDSPLTGSDTATKVSTGVDIATIDGTNTISTTLYNKPYMSVAYGYKGAGVHVDGWEFNFITSANGNQQLTKITMPTPLRAGETLTSEQAGVTIPTYAGAENTLSLYPNAAGYGNPEMTITYKGG